METRLSDLRQALTDGFIQKYPEEAARLMDHFPPGEIRSYLHALPISSALQVFIRINPEISEKLIPELESGFFRQLFSAMDAGDAARLLSRVAQQDADLAAQRLQLLPRETAEEIRELMQYPPETAGYFMDPRVLTFHAEDTVETALSRLRTVRKRRIVDIYIVDAEGRLVGMVPLQQVAVAHPVEPLGRFIDGVPVSVNAMAPRDEVVEILEKTKLTSLPVVDAHGKLVGVIRHSELVSAAQQQASEDLQTMFGAGRDERALSPATFAIRKRLPWLEINLATAFLASAVVGMFEDTIARITALAVFLPVVAGQSGNTGSQALAVTMRGLALREIRTRHWFQVARKEIMVGFVNGCAVASTTALIVYFWESSFGLAVVIGVSMIISMVIAGLAGAVIPILLRAFGQDPAQSSSIILTTVTDVVGFMSFLGLATALAGALGIG